MKTNKKLFTMALAGAVAVGLLGYRVSAYADSNAEVNNQTIHATEQLTKDKNGNWVNKDGQILMTKEQIEEGKPITFSGSVTMKDDVSLPAKGEDQTSQNTAVDSQTLVTSSNGTPVTFDKDGNIVDENGKVTITKDEIANGSANTTSGNVTMEDASK